MTSVIGIVGPIGSGKDTAADYISEKYGFKIFSFRDVVREATEKAGLKPDRENMQKFSRELRNKEGENVFAKMVLEKIISSGCEKALVKEMRTAGDVKVIWDHLKSSMKIIKVVAPVNVRFERMKERGRLGDPLTMEEFEKQGEREEELGYTKAFNFADFVVVNDKGKEELYNKLDEVMLKLNEDEQLMKRKFLHIK